MISRPLTCRAIRYRISQYVGQELPGADQEAWARHLAHCSDCRQEEAWERRMQVSLQVPAQPFLPEPPGLAERVRTGVPVLLRRRRRRRWAVRGSVLGLGLLLLTLPLWQGEPALPDGDPYQRLAQEVQRELFWTRDPSASSYQQFETRTVADAFFNRDLSRRQRSRCQEAAQQLADQLHHCPDDAQGWMLLGTFQLGLRQPQTSRQALRRALDLNPALAEIQRLRSESYRQDRQWEKALAAVNQALERAPQKAFLYCQRAAIQAGQRNWEAALEDLDRAEECDPRLPELYLGRGSVYLQQGGWRAAEQTEEALRKALTLDPSGQRARVLLGVAYCLRGRTDEAVGQAWKVLRRDSDYALAYLLLGWVYEEQGQHEAAVAAYQRALETAPEQEYAAFRLGRQYAILDRPEEARRTFENLVREDPQAPMLHLQLGAAYQQLGRFSEAVRELRIAQRQQPENAYAWVTLAHAWYTGGDPENGLKVLLPAARRFPQERLVFEVLYHILREVPRNREGIYGPAQAVLHAHRGPQTQQFLTAVQTWAQEHGVAERGDSQWAQAWRSLEAGDVIRAEQQGMALWAQYEWGWGITLGPHNQEQGVRLRNLPERDGGTQGVRDLGGRTARQTQKDRRQNHIYFDVAEDCTPDQGVWVMVTYWDAPENRFQIEYDSTDTQNYLQGAYKSTEDVWKSNRRQWQDYLFWLPDANFRGRQHGGADFRIRSRGWRDTAVHAVRVLTPAVPPSRSGKRAPATGSEAPGPA